MSDVKCVPDDVCKANMKMHDERFTRDKEILENHDKIIAELKAVSLRLDIMIEAHSQSINDHSARITTLEHRPGRLWDKVVGGVLAALSGGIAGALLATVLK